MPTQLERLDHEIARLQQKRVVAAREERKDRRQLDTRAKILIGAGLLALLTAGDRPMRRVYNAVREHLANDRRTRTQTDLDAWDAGDGARYAEPSRGAGAGAGAPAGGDASLTGPARPGEPRHG